MGKLDDGVPYQQAGLVEQLEAERANAEAYGNDTRVEAIDKQLKNLEESRGKKADEKQQAAESRAQAQPQHQPPVQRTPRPGVQQTTDK